MNTRANKNMIAHLPDRFRKNGKIYPGAVLTITRKRDGYHPDPGVIVAIGGWTVPGVEVDRDEANRIGVGPAYMAAVERWHKTEAYKDYCEHRSRISKTIDEVRSMVHSSISQAGYARMADEERLQRQLDAEKDLEDYAPEDFEPATFSCHR